MSKHAQEQDERGRPGGRGEDRARDAASKENPQDRRRGGYGDDDAEAFAADRAEEENGDEAKGEVFDPNPGT